MKSATESLDHASVKQYCKSVRVPVIAANFLTLAEQAVKENHSHIHYLEALLAMETEERDRHVIQNRVRDAQLPRMKTLEEFDFGQTPRIPAARVRELAEGVIGIRKRTVIDFRRIRTPEHKPGEKLFLDRAGATSPIHRPDGSTQPNANSIV
jgi:DNA replication protein DnaC